jgi:putative tricarboxylic transport membrane protein
VLLISGIVAARQTFKSSPIPGEAGESVSQQFMRLVTPAMLVQFVIAIAVYMVALEPVGFVVSSYLFLVISMWLLGSRKLFLNIWVSALVLACIYGIFQTIFAVVLPTGTLLQGILK